MRVSPSLHVCRGLLVLLFLVAACAGAPGVGAGLGPVADYGGRFEYRYGDAPERPDGAGAPAPAEPAPPGDGWRPHPGVGSPPGRGQADVLWLRTRLQGPALVRPVLAVRLAARTVRISVDGQAVVPQYATLLPVEQLVNLRREYLIPLAPDYAGKTLTLRLGADVPQLAMESLPRLGEAAAVAFDLVRRNAAYVLCSAFLILLTLCGCALFLFRRDEPLYLYFALGCLGFAGSLLGFSGLAGLLFPWPVPNDAARVLLNALSNVGLLSFVIRIIGPGPLRALPVMRAAYLLYVAVLAATLLVRPDVTLRLFAVGRILTAPLGLALVAGSLRGVVRGDVDARILSAGLIVCNLLALPEVLLSLGLRTGRHGQWYVVTVLTFIAALVVVLLRRFYAAHTTALKLQIEHALANHRLHEQEALLQASARMAKGDLEQPISADPQSPLLPLARALDGMRQDLRGRIRLMDRMQQDLRSQMQTLETRSREIGLLNDELRRQIEQRSRRLIDMLLPAGRLAQHGRELHEGELLGNHYRVLRRLGQGGMGTVYEVCRTTDDRHLAAKVLRGGSVHKEALGRFAREAQIMARLHHPHLIAISDVDVTDEGTLFLVMELVRGRSLAQLRERAADLAWARTVLAQVAEGLVVLHACGIVHRDVKPENILVDESSPAPLVKLADFGISRLSEEGTPPPGPAPAPAPSSDSPGADAGAPVGADAPAGPGQTLDDTDPALGPPRKLASGSGPLLPGASQPRMLTRTGVVMGTPGYLAPELTRDARHAQPAADVFSLAVLAVELLTGRRPAAGAALAGAGAEIDEGLLRLLERGLRAAPEERPTAQELARALRGGDDRPSAPGAPAPA